MIAQNIANIKKQIDYSKVTLIAVTKTRSVNEIQQAVNAGQQHFGENYLQESIEKIQSLEGQNLIWHFIGPIQSNKTALIAQNFDWVHSVDRFKIAKRLSEQRPKNLAKLKICIQINIDNEATKSGVLVEDLQALIIKIKQLENISLEGLMCIPKKDSKNAFANMQKLKEQFSLNELSMGMSYDFEEAIKFGSTMIRVGQNIFGARE
jgi:pyridoxal phosphate enzyme (YggS family)